MLVWTVMAAKRTTAQVVSRSEMPRLILRGKTQKVGPMTVRAVSPQAKRRRMATSAGAERGGPAVEQWNVPPADPAGICGATFERKRKWVASTLPPSGGNDWPARLSHSEMEPNGDKRRVLPVRGPGAAKP